MKPFITSQSGGGEYAVNIKVSSIEELHEAHDIVLAAFRRPSLEPVPAPSGVVTVELMGTIIPYLAPAVSIDEVRAKLAALTPLTQEPEPVAFVPVDATWQIHYIEIQTSLEHFASHWAEDGYTFKPLFATPIQAEPATGWVPVANVRKAYDVLLAGGAPYTARECKVSGVLDDALHTASPTPPVENVGEEPTP